MEHLAQLFPEHDAHVLKRHLDGASGILEAAINSLLDAPIESANIAIAQRNVEHAHYDQGSNRPIKRPRQNSVEYISSVNGADNNQVLDLTLDSTDDESDEVSETSQRLNHSHQQGDVAPNPLPSFADFHREQQRILEDNARRAAEIEEQKLLLVSNFVAIARDMFDNISEPYLVRLLEEKRSKITSDEELVDVCLEAIVALKGQYPKAKSERKRARQDDGEESDEEESSDLDELAQGMGSSVDVDACRSNSQKKRDYMDYGAKMRDVYETQCATQLYQDFPLVTATSIRACLKKYNFHYAPAFDHLNASWADHGTVTDGIKLSLMNKPRAKKPPIDPMKLDPEFRRELQWVKAKIEKELKQMQLAEDEERNLQYYKDRNELIECGCCYDEVPPNRMAQCEDGHLFCLECSKRGAEVELGYRRTVLKCMTGGCTAVFSDSEAVKFLSRPVFHGLLRARQQNELKMAGLDSLVECPFCSYAAVVENDMDKEFRCQAPKCLRISCRLCRAPTHIPLSCEGTPYCPLTEYQKELEKNNVLSAQHRVEEQMSQALIRECPKCKARFFKTEVCRLWENTIERNANEVKEAAQKTLLELQADRPELVSKVRLDIPK
ncbi:hypothetical protein BGZ80_000042 [Entomortierella chlamydospora]|uniref:Ring finger protein n=1 Tax=Entomortierella chlamydospora TaxID=101097 RepID=A0A9P6MTI3_9FUNG|nr:hypothetical protein BGZ80_000042 [Entomortierella chlamydospora]